MMTGIRIFKHKAFNQWAKTVGLTDKTLKKAVEELENGLFEANLGSGLYKKRIAMPGQGKRGSYRTLIAFKNHHYAFYVYGFAKNEQANIGEQEGKVYRQLAKQMLQMTPEALENLIKNVKLVEVK